MIKCIVFDIGGVLVRTGSFPKNVAFKMAMDLKIPKKGLYNELNRFLPDLEKDTKKLFFSENLYLKYATMYFKINRELLDFAIKLQKSFSIGIISNIDKWIVQIPQNQEVINTFDHHLVVLSYQVNSRKPQRKIFQFLLHKTKLNPEECLFIDNKEENVKAAQELGMAGIVFRNNKQLKCDIRQYI